MFLMVCGAPARKVIGVGLESPVIPSDLAPSQGEE